ncbi:hypothetical protein [Actinomadura algeriensis]|uniref:VWFA domain-containing protein n=1 Tax=Actinomadura algeriensis TaxID=1679523 RepID=A0ABR9JJJ0_9ACTN|nr:hypothetical protein [Actinomadura algeriensis]MBE1530707.1 hypothetical protein [Actinomadura algeriensis]
MANPGEDLQKSLTKAVRGLSGHHRLIVVEAAADGISTYQVQRNAADVPKARVWNATWEELSADGAPLKERVLAAARLDPEAVTLLTCTFPDGTDAAQAIAWLQAAAPDAQTHMAPGAALGELLRTVIADEPLTQLYELATLVPDPDGTLRFKGHRLFTVDSRRHDTVRLDLRFHQTDELGAALAVISWSERRFRLVSVQRAHVPPGRYEVIAELERPGRVRFHGLPAEPVRDDRTWDELVAAVPDRLPPEPPDVHLVCAIETAGPPERVAARLDRAAQFVRAAADDGGPGLTVSLVAYGPHAFVRRPPPAVKVIADRRSAADARRVLDALRDREPAGDSGYPNAAAVECALAEVDRLLAGGGRERPALLLIGDRPPHPPAVHPSEVLPCPEAADWQAALRALRRRPGLAVGAVTDRPARRADPFWTRLAGDALAGQEAVDVPGLGARLGLGPAEPRRVPFPFDETP